MHDPECTNIAQSNRDIISTWNEIGKPDFVNIGLQFPGNEPIYSIPWE